MCFDHCQHCERIFPKYLSPLHAFSFFMLIGINGWAPIKDQTVGRGRGGIYEMTYICVGLGFFLHFLASLFKNIGFRCFRCCGISNNGGQFIIWLIETGLELVMVLAMF